MNEELKPCHVCGSEAAVMPLWNLGNSVYQAGCTNKDCTEYVMHGWKYRSKVDAIAAWNRRANDE